jgi:hypothetical protein
MTSGVILLGALFKNWMGADALWQEVTTDVAVAVNPENAALAGRGEPLPGRLVPHHRPSLIRYLLFTRTFWLFARTLLTTGVSVGLVYLGGSASQHTFGYVVGVALVGAALFEWGPYSARNQWTDLRRRERLPFAPTRASHRANIYMSATVMAMRVVAPLVWVQILVPSELKWALWIAVILLFSVLLDSAVELRERRAKRRTLPSRALDVVARCVAFAARGVTAWQIAAFAGSPVGWLSAAAVIALAMFGGYWTIQRQVKEATILKDRQREGNDDLLDHASVLSAVKGVAGRCGFVFGEFLFGRAFEHVAERFRKVPPEEDSE